jgi:hypothetical protein
VLWVVARIGRDVPWGPTLLVYTPFHFGKRGQCVECESERECDAVRSIGDDNSTTYDETNDDMSRVPECDEWPCRTTRSDILVHAHRTTCVGCTRVAGMRES